MSKSYLINKEWVYNIIMNTTIINVLLFIGGMAAQCLLSAFLAYHREAKAQKQAQIQKLMETLAAAEQIIQRAKEEEKNA